VFTNMVILLVLVENIRQVRTFSGTNTLAYLFLPSVTWQKIVDRAFTINVLRSEFIPYRCRLERLSVSVTYILA
jgi:hypothetical protein